MSRSTGNAPSDSETLEIIKQILSFRDESELEEFITENDYFNKYCNWHPVGGKPDNVRFMNNQQSDPITALCEPIVNSIDSLLILGCRLEGNDPEISKSEDIPKSMQQASERYYKIPEGNLALLDEKKLSELADNIQLTLMDAGNKDDSIIYLYNKGTGQKPQDFRNTFLYHERSNKIKVMFVQGKYGMGSGGPISFCGINKYCFILSRIHPSLVSQAEVDKRKWGFTLIRKHFSKGDEKTDYFEFLSNKEPPPENHVIGFSAEEIPNALPIATKIDTGASTIAQLLKPMKEGTLIKYFNYQNRGNKAAGTIQRRLDLILLDPVLPMVIYD